MLIDAPNIELGIHLVPAPLVVFGLNIEQAP
jgi:hypothetical protein